MGRMDGKVALVAGNLGSMKKSEFIMGLGGFIAKDLANEGANVVVLDLDANISEACVKALGSDKIKAKHCDILKNRTSETKTYETERGPKTEVVWTDNPILELLEEIVKEYGELNAIVANFDYYGKGKIENVTEADYEKMKEQNIIPTFHLMAAAREPLAVQNKKTGKFAKIVLITNMVGKAGLGMSVLYSGFKAGIIGLNKTLAREFGRFANVNAVAIAPLSNKKLQGPSDRTKKQFFITSSDMAKMDIKPEHITPMVTFLCSDAAAGINGQSISIDGGLWLKLEQ